MTQLDPQARRARRPPRAGRRRRPGHARAASGRAAAAPRISRRLAVVVAVLAIAITGRRDRGRPADQHRRGGAEHARRHARAGRHRADLHRRHQGRRVPLRARQGAGIEVTDEKGNPAWKGTVEPSVDASKHVNGGCRSLANDGREWQCYIGQAAVDQKIIGAGLPGRVRAGARPGLISDRGQARTVGVRPARSGSDPERGGP